VRTLRADSGFFDGAFLGFLEERTLPYVIVARLTATLKLRLAGLGDWRELEGAYALAEFIARLQGWTRERRFVVVRERIRETKAAVGRKLLDVWLHLPALRHQPGGQPGRTVARLQPPRDHGAAHR
jgi:hypothetical protein